MSKALILTNLKRGSLEMGRALDITSDDALSTLDSLIKQYGFFIAKDGTGSLLTDWLVGNSDSTHITINPGKAIFQEAINITDGVIGAAGYPRITYLNALQTLTAPITNGTYNLWASYIKSYLEAGTIQVVSGSQNVVGINTEFTKIFAANRNLIIGNNLYLIQSVQDDTHLTLSLSYSGISASGLQFSVGGWFAVANPPATSDNIIYQYNGIAFQFLVSSSAPATPSYLLATVTISGGVITNISDQRSNNLLTLGDNAIDGVYAPLAQSATDASNFLVVGAGQTANFPSSYMADFLTYFLRADDGSTIGFKYTSKTGNWFLGVTFATNPGFTSAIGKHVFAVNSITINGDGLILGDTVVLSTEWVALTNGATSNAGSLHSHKHDELIDIASTSASKANLITLTAGPTVGAESLHTHNDLVRATQITTWVATDFTTVYQNTTSHPIVVHLYWNMDSPSPSLVGGVAISANNTWSSIPPVYLLLSKILSVAADGCCFVVPAGSYYKFTLSGAPSTGHLYFTVLG